MVEWNDTTPGPAQMRASDFQRIAEYAVGIGTNAQRDGQDVIDADFIRLAQQNGLPVHVYTINERPEMERLTRMGVNGLFTDFPDRLQSLIVE
jgi:glycerophosphoryl diester phosphodiesterase